RRRRDRLVHPRGASHDGYHPDGLVCQRDGGGCPERSVCPQGAIERGRNRVRGGDRPDFRVLRGCHGCGKRRTLLLGNYASRLHCRRHYWILNPALGRRAFPENDKELMMPRPAHFEIPAENPERAIAFYKDVFGWTFQKWDGPMPYWMITTGPDTEPGINGGLLS